MEFRPLSQCKSDLDFRPTREWARPVPVFCYKGQRLTGFDRAVADELAVELSGSLEKLLLGLYPELSFVELSRLYANLKRQRLSFDQTQFFENWGINSSEATMQTVDLLLELPESFLSYAAEKKFSPRDFEPLKLKQDMAEELIAIAGSGASKSEAVMLIELIADLKMLGRWPEVNLDWDQRPSEILESLRGLRYPKRMAFEAEARKKTKKLSWPKNAKWKWNIRTDQNILDLHLSLKSSEDLKSLAQQLEKISQQVSETGASPWP